MTVRSALVRLSPLAAALALGLTLSACSGTGLVAERTRGYVLSDDQIRQIQPGSSKDFVQVVLGSPQTTSTFRGETAWYYVETVVSQTAFGLTSVNERTVLAIYFGPDHRVSDRAIYTLEDGRVFAVEQRRTGSFGEDRNFIQSLLASI